LSKPSGNIQNSGYGCMNDGKQYRISNRLAGCSGLKEMSAIVVVYSIRSLCSSI
jgi:hypothetical protein